MIQRVISIRLLLLLCLDFAFRRQVLSSGIPFGLAHFSLGNFGGHVSFVGNNEAELSAIRAPCVFRADEEELHKYAAILAATEPFRLLCNTQIKKALNPIAYLFHLLAGKPLLNHALELRSKNKAIDLACDRYETRVESTLRSYGMVTADFNKISVSLNKDPILKQRILLQAYYYKIAADLEANLQPALPILPSLGSKRSDSLQIQSQGPPSRDKDTFDDRSSLGTLRIETGPSPPSPSHSYSYSSGGYVPSSPSSPAAAADDSQLRRFCRALRAIEKERLRHREYIKSELRIRELPQRMSDPEILPAMNPIIQKLSQEFPKTASRIIAQNGLLIEEFNSLQEKVEKNFFYRFAVQNEIKRIERESTLSPTSILANNSTNKKTSVAK